MKQSELELLFDRLFPLARSISGNGLRESLEIIREYIPLEIVEYPSGMKCFDWTVPDEWNIRDAYIKDPSGTKIIDFKKNNLHLMGYSIPFSGLMELDDLKKHIHTLPDKPDAIPFVTSYYKRDWGFCMSHRTLEELKSGKYEVLIDSTLSPGSVSTGQLFIKGKSKKEVLLFSHIGHPSLANDQLSGPVTLTSIAKWLHGMGSTPFYSYRIVLAPETIGSISFIKKNKKHLKRNCIGGYTIVNTADNGNLTFRKSKKPGSLTDIAMLNALAETESEYTATDFYPMGCDERHFNSHGIGIPVSSIMRTPPGEYPEYHTSLDNKEYISFYKMNSTVELVKKAILNLESNCRIYAIHKNCEPKLDKYGLYPTTSNRATRNKELEILITIWSLADGRLLSEVADTLGISIIKAREYADMLAKSKIIKIKEATGNQQVNCILL